MKILFVLEYFYPHLGGVETLFKNLTDELIAQNQEIGVITRLHKKDLPKKEIGQHQKIFRYNFPNRYFFTFLAIFPILAKIRKYDLVHTTSYNAALPAFLAAKLTGKPVIITFHEYWGDLWFKLPFMGKASKYLHYLFEKMLAKLPFDAFVAVSESTAENLRKAGVPAEKVKVIYNGIDYEAMDKMKQSLPKSDIFTIAYFGRLGISKGLDLLLETIKILKAKGVDFQLKLMIPQQPKDIFDHIQNFLNQFGLRQNVRFLHYLSYPELVKELQAVHGVVIPSYSEGFCFAAAECIALGVPIISSDQTALREVVSGKFIKMKEFSSGALTNAILKAKNEDWETAPIKKFELSETIKNYMALYKIICFY